MCGCVGVGVAGVGGSDVVGAWDLSHKTKIAAMPIYGKTL